MTRFTGTNILRLVMLRCERERREDRDWRKNNCCVKVDDVV